MRTVLFYVKFGNIRGATLKVWDYFRHVLAAPGFTARVVFTPDSRWDAANPWFAIPEYVVSDAKSVHADAFFMGTRLWNMAESHPSWSNDAPVIALVQGIRHADRKDDRFQYLLRPAIRICVSAEVQTAIAATQAAVGPVLAIPNCIDLSLCRPMSNERRRWDVLIAGLKQPELGIALRDRLQRDGHEVLLLDKLVPRADFLQSLRSARVTVFLPMAREGFYLPALEGLASDTLVVCPDCIGNRSFCLNGTNSIVPAFDLDALVEAACSALRLSQVEADRLKAEGRRTAALHSIEVERNAFHRVLQSLDVYWESARRAPPTPIESAAT